MFYISSVGCAQLGPHYAMNFLIWDPRWLQKLEQATKEKLSQFCHVPVCYVSPTPGPLYVTVSSQSICQVVACAMT